MLTLRSLVFWELNNRLLQLQDTLAELGLAKGIGTMYAWLCGGFIHDFQLS